MCELACMRCISRLTPYSSRGLQMHLFSLTGRPPLLPIESSSCCWHDCLVRLFFVCTCWGIHSCVAFGRSVPVRGHRDGDAYSFLFSLIMPSPIRPSRYGWREGTPRATCGSPIPAPPSLPTATCSPMGCACAPRPATASTPTPESATRRSNRSRPRRLRRCARRLPRALRGADRESVRRHRRRRARRNPVRSTKSRAGPRLRAEALAQHARQRVVVGRYRLDQRTRDLRRPPAFRMPAVRRRFRRSRSARRRQRARQGIARGHVRALRLAGRRDLARRRRRRPLFRGRQRHGCPQHVQTKNKRTKQSCQQNELLSIGNKDAQPVKKINASASHGSKKLTRLFNRRPRLSAYGA